MQAIQQAIKFFGSQADMADAMNVKQPTVSEWARGARPVPIERCVDLERLTKGAVKRWDLRPDDWHRIWPELVGTKGAPKAPAKAA